MQMNWAVHAIQDFPAEKMSAPDAGNVVDQDPEFIAAEPSDHSTISDYMEKARSDLVEQLVAGSMAEGIINRFKPVEIEYRNGKRAAPSGTFERCHESPTIWQSS